VKNMCEHNAFEGIYSRRSKRWKLTLILLVLALMVTVIVALNIGYAPISFSQILSILGNQVPILNWSIDSSSFSATSQAIILELRLPRVLAGVFIGAGLSVAGVLYQGVFKNPMSDPYVLGVSAGASLGLLLLLFSGLG
jgi:iron complex transport system permease protein